MPASQRQICLVQAAVVIAALIVTGVATRDRLTWLLEVLPVLIALPLMAGSYRRFPLTPLLYWVIACHALVLIVGGFWTYAHVPLGFWVQDLFSLSRNPYDKLGHFMQGLTPALLAREILIRRGDLRVGKMAAFLAICVAGAFSACYELIEWGAAVALGQGADEFLGTQGDPWDTQSDMLMALIGASVAMSVLTRWQDRQIQAIRH
jgi:putative membrane protein